MSNAKEHLHMTFGVWRLETPNVKCQKTRKNTEIRSEKKRSGETYTKRTIILLLLCCRQCKHYSLIGRMPYILNSIQTPGKFGA
ncbi:hypothetical protein ACJIZ3_009969 [Penstemon smallii]|uniref:Uncharacterized protein n=1 Tax=Penstemon smallii TaxID=265156 RepID=A0ABD3TGC1_9LAMI